MTTDDWRTRAREAAAILYADPVKDSAAVYTRHALRYYQRGAYEAGYLAHAAQQPTREQVAEVLAVQWFAPSWGRATNGQQCECLRVADRVLALLNGDKS